MRRRKNRKVYIHVSRPQNSTESVTTPFASTPELRDFGMKAKRCVAGRSRQISQRSRQTSTGYAETTGGDSVKNIRKKLQVVTSLNAVFCALVSVNAYLSVRSRTEVEGRELIGIRLSLWSLSVLQTGLVVTYLVLLRKYMEKVRVCFRLSRTPIQPFWKSPGELATCGLECVFLLILPPPFVQIQGTIEMQGTLCDLSLDDFLYPVILLRNYHIFRFLFWMSRFSKARTCLYSALVNNRFTSFFVLKCILKTLALKLVLSLYCALIVGAGLSLYVLEKGTPDPQRDEASTNIWVAALTALTLGYGDITPTTYFGRLVAVLTCFLACFLSSLVLSLAVTHMALTPREGEMYSTLAVARYKGKYTEEARVLLQAWWRFILMRQKGAPHAQTIIHFYSLLREYREIISGAHRQKESNLGLQSFAVETSLHRQFRRVNEYLISLESTRNVTLDIARAQYQIKETCRHLCKCTLKLSRSPRKSLSIELSGSVNYLEPKRTNTLGVPRTKRSRNALDSSRAKLKARQRVQRRLVKDQKPSEVVLTSVYSSSEVSSSLFSEVGPRSR